MFFRKLGLSGKTSLKAEPENIILYLSIEIDINFVRILFRINSALKRLIFTIKPHLKSYLVQWF